MFQELTIKSLLGLLSMMLFTYGKDKVAKYAKWLIQARDYILILFPIELYPPVDTAETMKLKKAAVPVAVAEKAASDGGFTIKTN